jgi:hypothetical protein
MEEKIAESQKLLKKSTEKNMMGRGKKYEENQAAASCVSIQKHRKYSLSR